jgi:hypothetical protein
MNAYIVPDGLVLIGTCGECGGPVLAPQVTWSDGTATGAVRGQCATCKRVSKPEAQPTFGPILGMD